jgi:uncharacterized protein (DUF362 family)
MPINEGVSMSRSLSRKDFLRISTLSLGALTGGRLLSACNPASTSMATAVPPTATTTSTLQSATPKPEILQFYPTIPSKVIHTHHAGVWAGEKLTPAALREMVDDSITNLTGLTDAKEAWAALFKPTERIAIKVNAFQNSTIWTHAPLVQAVTDSLVEAGHPAEQIVIYDTTNYELETAGFTINKDGPGVRCYGTESHYKEGWKVGEADVQLSTILLDCDALINMPVLKSHMIAAMTYSLKNHFGTVSNPGSLHGNIDAKIAGLNALPEIKGKTRLVIGDALEANLRYKNSWPYWEADWKGDSIVMSYDPVAVDTVGAQILEAARGDDGFASRAIAGFDEAAKLGLGTNDPANISVIERKLG